VGRKRSLPTVWSPDGEMGQCHQEVKEKSFIATRGRNGNEGNKATKGLGPPGTAQSVVHRHTFIKKDSTMRDLLSEKNNSMKDKKELTSESKVGMTSKRMGSSGGRVIHRPYSSADKALFNRNDSEGK